MVQLERRKVGLRFSAKTHNHRLRQKRDLAAKIQVCAASVALAADFTGNRTQAPFGQPDLSQLLLKRGIGNNLIQKPSQVAVEQVG